MSKCEMFVSQEKQNSMSDELGRDTGSVSALQRKHSNFETDLTTLAGHVSILLLVFTVLSAINANQFLRYLAL